MKRKSTTPKTIVLDLDKTLIDSIDQKIITRPYLREFLKFCFDTFDHVGIWTAATNEWCYHAFDTIFDSILIDLDETFAFVYTRDNCKKVIDESGDKYYTKPLCALNDHADGPFYDVGSTLIIDDSILTFMYNTKNCILIPEFNARRVTRSGNHNSSDDVLLRLIQHIENFIEYYHIHGTMFTMPKRYRLFN